MRMKSIMRHIPQPNAPLASPVNRHGLSAVQIASTAVIFVVTSALLLNGCAPNGESPSSQVSEDADAPVVELHGSLQLLQQQFNRDRGNLRAIALFSPTCSGCVYGARAVKQEIVDAGGNANVRVYFVWMPMLPTDDKPAALKMARSLTAEHAFHFYDAERLVGIRFVEDHFDAHMKKALSALAADHPLRERLASHTAAPAKERPLWDALLMFSPEAQWNQVLPEPNWWTRQVGFTENPAKGEPTGQFWRQGVNSGLVMSDWFNEARDGLTTMNVRGSR
jgi:hypothetical protein